MNKFILGSIILSIIIVFFWLMASQARKFGQEQEKGMHRGRRSKEDKFKGGLQ